MTPEFLGGACVGSTELFPLFQFVESVHARATPRLSTLGFFFGESERERSHD